MIVSAVFLLCSYIGYRRLMTGPSVEKLTPAEPEDLARPLAFALKFEGRKR
jgi:hypothetical protein